MKLYIFQSHGQILIVRAETLADAAALVAASFAMGQPAVYYAGLGRELSTAGPPGIVLDITA